MSDILIRSMDKR